MSRQTISRFIFCLLLLSATACGQGSDDNLVDTVSSTYPGDTDYRPPLEGSVVINEMDGVTTLGESDAYELETDGGHEPVIENDTLTLTVSYGGGCARHDFTLFTEGIFMESDPVQLVVTLTHDANDDPCEAYLTNSHVFDLTPIRTLYQEAYRTDEGSIILHLRHLGDPGTLSLVYTFGS